MDKSSPNYIFTHEQQTIFVGFSITLVGLVNYMYLKMYPVKDRKQFYQLPAIYPSCINVENVCHVVSPPVFLLSLREVRWVCMMCLCSCLWNLV